MDYPFAQAQQEKKLKAMQNEKYMLTQLAKTYNSSKTIHEYKVLKDVNSLKCPAIVDVFVIYYLFKNYGRFQMLMYNTLICLAISLLVPFVVFICMYTINITSGDNWLCPLIIGVLLIFPALMIVSTWLWNIALECAEKWIRYVEFNT